MNLLKTITQNDLDLHAKWLRNEHDGVRLVTNTGRIELVCSLFRANLSSADLSSADLSAANLSCANLSGAALSGADLSGADLFRANLSGADLSDANLFRANLSDANLSGANLFRANLSGANLFCAKNAELAEAITSILPAGTLTVYKKAKCRSLNVLLTLEIPAEAKRSNASGRKCRAEYAILRAIEGIGFEYTDGQITSTYDSGFVYPAIGESITPNGWDDNRWNECSKGIHFFITRYEAEHYGD